MNGQFSSLDEFWPFYLSQHQNRANRRLHFAGSTVVIALAVLAALRRSTLPLAAAPLAGYGCAWVGHFFFERNRPATFRHPWLSLRADARMYVLTWTGELDAEILRLTRGIRAFGERR